MYQRPKTQMDRQTKKPIDKSTSIQKDRWTKRQLSDIQKYRKRQTYKKIEKDRWTKGQMNKQTGDKKESWINRQMIKKDRWKKDR